MRSRGDATEFGELEAERSCLSLATESPRRGPANQHGLSEEQFSMLHDAFTRFDNDGSGTIDASELQSLLISLDVDVGDANEAEIAALVREIDGDGSGTIDFEEFCRFYRHVVRAAKRSDRKSGVAWREDTGQDEAPEEKLKIGGLLNMVRQGREEEKKDEEYLTEKQRAARQRIHDMLYNLPSFAPDYVYRRWWDVAVLCCILYLWLLPTTELVLELDPTSDLRLGTDIAVTVLLCADILVNMNTAVQLEQRSLSMVVDRGKIWRIYLRSYFFIDLLSAMPVDVIVWVATDSARWWRLARVLRLLKLLKARALFKFTDRGMMDPSFVNFYFIVKPLLFSVFQICCVAHSLALGRILVSPSYDSCEGIVFGLNTCVGDPASRYLYALWWCWALLTTQGMASVENGTVYAYAALVMFGSILLQGLFIARWSAFFLKSNIEEQNRDSMRSTYAIMRQYGIPGSLQQEVLSFQYHSLQQSAASNFAHILERLPAPMQREVGLYVKVDLVAKVPMFESLSTDCKLDLGACLEQTYCEPECFIVEFGEEGREMYFMMHGFADVITPSQGDDGVGNIVATVKRGDFFGEVALLRREQKRGASIQALTYCDLFQLLSEDFDLLLERYSELRLRVEAEARARGLLDEGTASSRKGSRKSDTMGRSQSNSLFGFFGNADMADAPADGTRRQSVKVLGFEPAPLATRRRSEADQVAGVRRASLHPLAAAAAPEHHRRSTAAPLFFGHERRQSTNPLGPSDNKFTSKGSFHATKSFRNQRDRHRGGRSACLGSAPELSLIPMPSDASQPRDGEKPQWDDTGAEIISRGSCASSATSITLSRPASGFNLTAPVMPSWEADLATVIQKSANDRRSFIAVHRDPKMEKTHKPPPRRDQGPRPSSAPLSPRIKVQAADKDAPSRSVSGRSPAASPRSEIIALTPASGARSSGYMSAVDDRIALAEARMLRRVHIAEERVRRDIWEQGRLMSKADARLSRIHLSIDRLDAKLQRILSRQQTGDFGGMLGGMGMQGFKSRVLA